MNGAEQKNPADGVISKAEYTEWKLNWLDIADDLGKYKSTKQWKKESADQT